MALAREGHDAPTPIQKAAIPVVLKGRDLLGIAQTGTGKTAAFALPILNHLAKDRQRPAPRECRVLVLAPTRELALQVKERFDAYGAAQGLATGLVIGGVAFAISSGNSYDDADTTRGKILAEKEVREADGIDVGAPCSGPDAAHFSQACGVWQDSVDEGDSKKTLSTVFFVGAGVGAAVVVGGYFLTAPKTGADTAKSKNQRKQQAVRTQLVPVAGPDVGGFVFRGQF